MKYLFLLFISMNAQAACVNKIAQSEVAAAIALSPGVGAVACGGADPCVCFDGIDWRAAKVSGGVLVNDPTKLAAARADDAAAKTAKAAAETQEKIDISDLKAKIQAGTATNADLIKAIKILLSHQ